MAEGFGAFKEIQRPHTKEDAGYKTIFEKIQEAADGDKKSFVWYRNQVRTAALSYNKNPEKLIRDEIQDRMGSNEQEDENQLRKWAVAGHMFLFEYKAKYASKLPYWDQFPLVYVIKANAKEFWGANLHYLSPKKRVWCVKRLQEGRVDIPRFCFHKYLTEHVDGYFLDLAADEWASAILLPIESFVKNVKGKAGHSSYNREIVWDDGKDKFYDKIKSRVIVRGYGKTSDREMVK